MKKIISFFFLLFCINAVAQDIIVKRNHEKVDAIIIEITSNEVKYKRKDYQEGPIYVLDKSEILTIIYQNGTVETFDANNKTSKQMTEESTQTKTTSFNDVNLNYIPPFERSRELEKFCPDAYDYLASGRRFGIAGGVLFGVAVIGITSGIIGFCEGNNAVGYIGLIGFGLPCTPAAILCITGASRRQKIALEKYEECVDRVNNYNTFNKSKGINLELQSGQDGLTFALKF